MNRSLGFLLVLCLLVAACAGAPEETAAPTATEVAGVGGGTVASQPTQPAPADTPEAAPTAAPTASLEPTLTAQPTASPAPSNMPVPSATPTFTPSEIPTIAPSPTVTATPLPTNTTVVPTRKPRPTATPQPPATKALTFAAPKLVRPFPEDTLVDRVRFEWEWNQAPLPQGYAFDLRIWSEREEKAGAVPRGAVELTRSNYADVTLRFVPAMEFGEGIYYWTVVVVRNTRPPQVVGQWGEKRWFVYREPTPTPTETPRPTRTPTPTPPQ